MLISARQLGKKFRNEWIFRNFDFDFHATQAYAVVGANGSGKSTLLKVLAGFIPHSSGHLSIQYPSAKALSIDVFYRHLAWVAPYIELPEELTLCEAVHFHAQFKPLSISEEEIIAKLEFSASNKHKEIRFFSSGMKQKLKLALAFYGKSEVIFLDEPTVNLDNENTNWYLRELEAIQKNKLLVIGSNVPHEYEPFDCEKINIMDFKKDVRIKN